MRGAPNEDKDKGAEKNTQKKEREKSRINKLKM